MEVKRGDIYSLKSDIFRDGGSAIVISGDVMNRTDKVVVVSRRQFLKASADSWVIDKTKLGIKLGNLSNEETSILLSILEVSLGMA